MSLSPREFAQRVEVHEATVSRWERGLARPERKHLARLFQLLKPAMLEQQTVRTFLALIEDLAIQLPLSAVDVPGADRTGCDKDIAEAWQILSRSGPVTPERIRTEAEQLHALIAALNPVGVAWRYHQMIEQVTQAEWAYEWTPDGYQIPTADGGEALALIHTELAFTCFEAVATHDLRQVIQAGEQALVHAVNAAFSLAQRRRLEAPAYLILGLTARRLENELQRRPSDVQLHRLLAACMLAAGFEPENDSSEAIIAEARRTDQRTVDDRLARCERHTALMRDARQ